MPATHDRLTKLKDYSIAEALSMGSLIAKHGSLFQNINGLDSNKYLDLRWRHLRQDPQQYNRWKVFDPDVLLPHRSNSIRPAKFDYAITMTAWRDQVDRYRTSHRGQHAVAYRLGQHAVMLGTHEDATFFGIHPERTNNYVIGMRLGETLLEAHMGIYSDEDGFKPLTNMVPTSELLIDTRRNISVPIV